jgi:hypothetical protein
MLEIIINCLIIPKVIATLLEEKYFNEILLFFIPNTHSSTTFKNEETFFLLNFTISKTSRSIKVGVYNKCNG